MRIVFFSHPNFTGHQSMPRFTKMLSDGMKKRGHSVEVLSPKAFFLNLPSLAGMKKWLGYIDQYVIFPMQVRRRLKKYSDSTLCVFIDQALGPWVPLVTDRPHVIHCHDFLAQFSAIGRIAENPVGWTGRQYQAFIRRGYKKGKNFISVSNKTDEDLHSFLPQNSFTSKVVYNGLNNSFGPLDPYKARLMLGNKTQLSLTDGYLLHVGGNQWYKNRQGVIDIYEAWRSQYSSEISLVMIGESPSYDLKERYDKSAFKKDIHFLTNVEDQFVRIAYAGASIFLYPSFAEGFGWPIAEAMACGCPVITTGKAPMTEVAGNAGFFIHRRPNNEAEIVNWANTSAKIVNEIFNLPSAERQKVVSAGIENAKRFDTEKTLNQIEKIYLDIVSA